MLDGRCAQGSHGCKRQEEKEKKEKKDKEEAVLLCPAWPCSPQLFMHGMCILAGW